MSEVPLCRPRGWCLDDSWTDRVLDDHQEVLLVCGGGCGTCQASALHVLGCWVLSAGLARAADTEHSN